MEKRIIVIGCREEHDRNVLKRIADWSLMNNRRDLFELLSVNKLDHYDMTTKPHKGDAVEAVQQHKDTIGVIALHLFGLDDKKRGYDKPKNRDQSYMYTKSNHKLIDLCLKRNIPLICWGDQPFHRTEKLPPHIQRTTISDAIEGRVPHCYGRDGEGMTRMEPATSFRFPIFMYEHVPVNC